MQGILVMPPYNAASRISAETDTIDGTNRSYTFARDSDDQLLTAVTPEGTYTFTVDERNNRSTKRLQTPSSDTTEYYTYNEGDQLLSMTRKDTVTQTILVSYTYAYDAQGRRTSQTKTSVTPPEVTSYSYQVGGNLEQITLPDSSTIQYQYDAYGNRIQKETSTELITYHYSGASLQQEVHKDPSTLTILYTLTYVPWGFVKTIGQTSTSYYYLYDQRGNTRGITDAQGTILETYHYSPYGILLSTPSISQPHFLSGNAQCQYKAESSLYYMHARYYDAHTGRFLTKDALPGSMSSPLSQNRYTYCQNDPITLIDPTGNSPENTGNPPRMSGPHVNPSSDPCVLPDVAGDSGAVHFSGMGIPGKMEIQKPNPAMVIGGTSPGVLTAGYDACGERTKTLESLLKEVSEIAMSGEFEKAESYNIEIDGQTIHVVVKDGKIVNAYFLSGNNPIKGEIIAQAINDAAHRLQLHGGGIKDILALLNSLDGFFQKHYKEWNTITGGTNDGGLYNFIFHAVRGIAIGQYLACTKYRGDVDKGQFDDMIGFWVSFWDIKFNLNLDLYSENADKSDFWNMQSFSFDNRIGLIDMAIAFKALIYKENASLDPKLTNSTNDFGLMSINGDTINGYIDNGSLLDDYKGYMKSGDWKTKAFGNLFLGMGVAFNKLNPSQSDKNNQLTFGRFFHGALAHYNWGAHKTDMERVCNYFVSMTGYHNASYQYFDNFVKNKGWIW